MSRPISDDERSPADVALLALVSWAGILLLAGDGIRSLSRLEALVRRAAWAGGLLGLLGVVQFTTGQVVVDLISIPGLTPTSNMSENFLRNGLVRPWGTATHPIEYGVLLAMLLPLALHLGFTARRSNVLLRWAPTLLISAPLAVSSSRSAYLAALVGVVVCALGWSWRQRAVALVFGCAGVVGLAVVIPRLLRSVLGMFANVDSDPSIASRTDSFAVAWQFFMQHPFLGRGLGTFLPKYRIFDNEYLLLLVSTGLLGLLAFVTLGVVALAGLLRTARIHAQAERERDLAFSLTAGVASGFVSLAFFDAFAFPMTMGTLFLLLGLGGAAVRLMAEPRPSPNVRSASP
ncbi:O-antigen ligase family protein [Salana multivorans]